MISPFMEAGGLCNTRYNWQHVTSLARSNKKLGILSVMNNMHDISIIGEADGDIAIASDNVDKCAVIFKINAAKRSLKPAPGSLPTSGSSKHHHPDQGLASSCQLQTSQ